MPLPGDGEEPGEGRVKGDAVALAVAVRRLQPADVASGALAQHPEPGEAEGVDREQHRHGDRRHVELPEERDEEDRLQVEQDDRDARVGSSVRTRSRSARTVPAWTRAGAGSARQVTRSGTRQDAAPAMLNSQLMP